MGKYSDFKRMKADFYRTPVKAVKPLLPYLPKTYTYCEPCVGDGALVEGLLGGTCRKSYDIENRGYGDLTRVSDALSLTAEDVEGCEYIITNPPWTRKILHPMIETLSALKPTWLLFDSNWANTKQAKAYGHLCRRIVPVGRVSWMGNGQAGKEDASWYLFDANDTSDFKDLTIFEWRE